MIIKKIRKKESDNYFEEIRKIEKEINELGQEIMKNGFWLEKDDIKYKISRYKELLEKKGQIINRKK